jgi:hypothetical protein
MLCTKLKIGGGLGSFHIIQGRGKTTTTCPKNRHIRFNPPRMSSFPATKAIIAAKTKSRLILPKLQPPSMTIVKKTWNYLGLGMDLDELPRFRVTTS